MARTLTFVGVRNPTSRRDPRDGTTCGRKTWPTAADHLSLDPGWRPFVIEARVEIAADGRPFNLPLARPR